MATTPRRTPAHQMFNNVLSSLHEHSGNDTKDEIAGVVVRVPELYPDYRGGIPAGLSPINIYKKLRGDHLTLPTGPQLSVLVLALQHLAYRGHVRDDDPGCATLPGWQALLNQARMLDRHQRSQGRYIRDSEHGVDRPLTLPVPVPPGSAVRTSAAHIEVASIDVTAVEVHQLVALGHYARTLALRASDADPGAFYEIAVALGTAEDPYRGRAGVFAVAAAAAARGPSPPPTCSPRISTSTPARSPRTPACWPTPPPPTTTTTPPASSRTAPAAPTAPACKPRRRDFATDSPPHGKGIPETVVIDRCTFIRRVHFRSFPRRAELLLSISQ